MKKIISLMFMTLFVFQISNATVVNNDQIEPNEYDCYEVAVDLFNNSRDILGLEQSISISAAYYTDCINGEFE